MGNVTVNGAVYYFRSISAREYAEIFAILQFGAGSPKSFADYQAALLAAMLSDDTGNQLLRTDDESTDLELLGNMEPALFLALFNACEAHLETISPSEAKKNLSSTTGADSPTS